MGWGQRERRDPKREDSPTHAGRISQRRDSIGRATSEGSIALGGKAPLFLRKRALRAAAARGEGDDVRAERARRFSLVTVPERPTIAWSK
jgi:hypothetical protein